MHQHNTPYIHNTRHPEKKIFHILQYCWELKQPRFHTTIVGLLLLLLLGKKDAMLDKANMNSETPQLRTLTV